MPCASASPAYTSEPYQKLYVRSLQLLPPLPVHLLLWWLPPSRGLPGLLYWSRPTLCQHSSNLLPPSPTLICAPPSALLLQAPGTNEYSLHLARDRQCSGWRSSKHMRQCQSGHTLGRKRTASLHFGEGTQSSVTQVAWWHGHTNLHVPSCLTGEREGLCILLQVEANE